MVGISVE